MAIKVKDISRVQKSDKSKNVFEAAAAKEAATQRQVKALFLVSPSTILSCYFDADNTRVKINNNITCER